MWNKDINKKIHISHSPISTFDAEEMKQKRCLKEKGKAPLQNPMTISHRLSFSSDPRRPVQSASRPAQPYTSASPQSRTSEASDWPEVEGTGKQHELPEKHPSPHIRLRVIQGQRDRSTKISRIASMPCERSHHREIDTSLVLVIQVYCIQHPVFILIAKKNSFRFIFISKNSLIMEKYSERKLRIEWHTYSGRYCISEGKLRSVFFLQLIISSTRTPKLYMSAFSDSSPLMAYSGAV